MTWEEAEHPRDRRGRFAEKRGGWVDRVSDRMAGGSRFPNYQPGRDMSGEAIAAAPTLGRFYVEEDPNRYGDLPLEHLARMQGFDGLPAVGTKQELDAAIAEGGVELWRGVGGGMPQIVGYGPDKGRFIFNRERSPIAYHEQWRTGEYRGGSGIYGQGLYASVDPRVGQFWGVRLKDKDGRQLENFEGGRRPAAVTLAELLEEGPDGVSDPRSQMRLVLNPQARVIDYDDPAFGEYRQRVRQELAQEDFFGVARQMLADDPDVGEEELQERGEDFYADEISRLAHQAYVSARAVLVDYGRAAVAMGYDAVRIEAKRADRGDGSGLDKDQYILLNRTALLVEEAYDESQLPFGVVRSDGTWGQE